MSEELNAVYTQRNRCVAFMAKWALAHGWKAGIGQHEMSAGQGEPGWTVIYIDLPTGQVSWHVPEADMPLFDGLPPYERRWDGHRVPEKYERMAKMGSEQFDSPEVKRLKEQVEELEIALRGARAGEEVARREAEWRRDEIKMYFEQVIKEFGGDFNGGDALMVVAREAAEKIRRFNAREMYLENQLDQLKEVARDAMQDAEAFLTRQGYAGSWVITGLGKALHKLVSVSRQLHPSMIGVCKGDPTGVNKGWVLGDEWKIAMGLFKNQKDVGDYTFWYWPGNSPHSAYKLQVPEEVDWEHSGIT